MTERSFAVVGLFDSPDALLRAVAPVREKNLGRVEAYTPYPVHGLATALGIKRSPIGGMVLVMALLGAATALGFQWWMAAHDYPIVTGGKALFSWEAFVPVMFEVMVAFATFTAGLAMLFLLNRLPYFSHPMLGSQVMAAVTRDRFALAIESDAANALDVAAARAALESAGAQSVESVPLPPAPQPPSARVLGWTLAGIAAACLVAGLLTYWTVKLFPILPPMVHMQQQPRINPQSESAFFEDSRTQRLAVAGAVPRGPLPYAVTSSEESDHLVNPLPRSTAVLAQGRHSYNTFCSVCHGPLATGVGTLTSAYGAKPANLQAQAIRNYTDGRIYDVIVRGKNAMPSYAEDMSGDERWAVVHYVRALQRAQNAREEDLR
jgi:mono/diheme cytochrome c family protein